MTKTLSEKTTPVVIERAMPILSSQTRSLSHSLSYSCLWDRLGVSSTLPPAACVSINN